MLDGVRAAAPRDRQQRGRRQRIQEACLKAQIFTQHDCTCVEGKATAAEKPDMVAFLTGDEVIKQGGKLDQAQMERGMTVMGKHVEACEKEK